MAPCPSVAIQKAHFICGTYAAPGSKGAPAVTSKGGAVSTPTSEHHKTSYFPTATSKGGPVAVSLHLRPLCQCNRLANTIFSPITHFAHCKGVLRSSFSTDTKDMSVPLTHEDTVSTRDLSRAPTIIMVVVSARDHTQAHHAVIC